MSTTEKQAVQWSQLLNEAVTVPGTIEKAFSAFHAYSLGNRLAALFQCAARGIEPGPIATFPRWIELGRHVKKGAKAIVLCQPVTFNAKRDEAAEVSDAPEAEIRTGFMWRPRWFVLAQTEGVEYAAPAAIASWNRVEAMAKLEITEVPFAMMDGNVQGYAKGRELAMNPVAANPAATLFHELAHIVLGHTAKEAAAHDTTLPRNLREVEAESVALLCLETLQLPGGEFCRGYIQNWYGLGNPIPESSAQRIFGAADQILRAGGVA